MNSIGEVISKYRKKAHLSQKELAEKLSSEGIEVTNKAVSSWEKGRAEPGARTFLYVCRVLEIPDCVEAFFGSNPANPMVILNDEGKAKVLDYIDFLVHPVCYVKESENSLK